jgi:excinuclease ABC subunit A
VGVIAVRGAAEHNLKDLSVEIPKNQLVVVTGVSGSGKSSLVFDTLYAESFRRFADASGLPSFMLGGSIEIRSSRPRVSSIQGLPPALGLSQRQGVAGRLSTVGTICGATDLLRVFFAAFGLAYCRSCAIPLRPTPPDEVIGALFERFSGAMVTIVAPVAERRKGLFAQELDAFRKEGFSRLRVNGQLFDLQEVENTALIDPKKLNTIELLVDRVSVSEEKRKRIERVVAAALNFGKGVVKVEGPLLQELFNTKSACPQCGESSPKLDPRHFSHSSLGQCPTCEGSGASEPERAEDLAPCRACNGSRLDAKLPLVRIGGLRFDEVARMTAAGALQFVREMLVPQAGESRAKAKVVRELELLLATLVRLGAGHLSLNRAGQSLVPGDLQRLRLASMIAAPFSGALYILDEPCQGLTHDEVDRFVAVLRDLVDRGATVLAVEHHPAFLERCDTVITMGPGAGEHGGRICEIASRPLTTVVASAEPSRDSAKSSKQSETPGASSLLLRNVDLRGARMSALAFNVGGIHLLRGPSGSGKSSLLRECLEPILARTLAGETSVSIPYADVAFGPNYSVTHLSVVRPGSLTRTTRRTVAAALEVLPPLRALFGALPQAQLMGLAEMHFSWSSKLGRCETCEGRGFIELKQRYGTSVEIECESCLGAKLGSRSLVPRFKGLNFAELMELSIDEAAGLFENFRLIHQRLTTARQFGLGYVKLGQTMESLSGGEMQRLLLVMELRRSNLLGAWFLLMHPGTGLHAPDIEVLGELLRTMAERGATFVLVENREEFLAVADSVVEFSARGP